MRALVAMELAVRIGSYFFFFIFVLFWVCLCAVVVVVVALLLLLLFCFLFVCLFVLGWGKVASEQRYCRVEPIRLISR